MKKSIYSYLLIAYSILATIFIFWSYSNVKSEYKRLNDDSNRQQERIMDLNSELSSLKDQHRKEIDSLTTIIKTYQSED